MLGYSVVSTAVTSLVLLVNIVSGQNSSSTSYFSSTATSTSRTSQFETTQSIFNTSQYVGSTDLTTQLRTTKSHLPITSSVPQSTTSKPHFLSSASFLSTEVLHNLSLISYVSFSKSPSKSSKVLTATQMKTSVSLSSSNAYPSVFTTSNFNFPTTLLTSSTQPLQINSSLTHVNKTLRQNYSMSALSSMHRSTRVSSNISHSSATLVMSKIQTASAALLITSSREPNSSVATSTVRLSTGQSYSFSISSALSSQSSVSSFSTTFFTGARQTGTTAITYSVVSSSTNIPATSSPVPLHPSSQSLSLKPPVSSHSDTLTSIIEITAVRPSPSEQRTLHNSTSQIESRNRLTKPSSSSTKVEPLSSMIRTNSIFIQFDGKLVVVPMLSQDEHNLKRFADSIESVLDDALNQAVGYVYSKVLVITRISEDKYDCRFQILIRKPSTENAMTLQKLINTFNKTSGFGRFMLYSTKISGPIICESPTPSLYLWAIIVIAVLGVICVLLLVAIIYTRRKIKKSKKRKYSSPKHDNNSNPRFSDIFPPVFDGNDEPKNEPLKLTSVSSTESKNLKQSGVADTNLEQDETLNGRQSDESSVDEETKKDDVEEVVQAQSHPGSDSLQIQDSSDEYDETKFSTFSRKR